MNHHKITHLFIFPTLFLALLSFAPKTHAQDDPIFVTPPSQPTEVQLGLFLIGIDKISPPGNNFPTFEAEMFLDMKWHDPRLAFDATATGTDQEVFLEHEAELELDKIWWPDIEIENGEGTRQTENLELIISADGTVEYEERLVATIETDFDMHQFPFDVQDLELDIESFAWDNRYVVFTSLEEKIGTEADHAGSEWLITTVNTEIHPEPEIRSDYEFSEFIFKVHVERLPGYYLWRLVPMFIIIVLSWSNFWMEGEPMPGRMGRSFTALLIVVAFHRIVSDMMPRISYMTFLDSLVLIAYLFSSITIIENVMVNHYRVQNNNAAANRIDQMARWVVPISFVILSGVVGFLFLR